MLLKLPGILNKQLTYGHLLKIDPSTHAFQINLTCSCTNKIRLIVEEVKELESHQ